MGLLGLRNRIARYGRGGGGTKFSIRRSRGKTSLVISRFSGKRK